MLLLYTDPNQHYIAVEPALGFAPVNGFKFCFKGRLVPLVLCDAFIREFGGHYVLRSAAQ